MFRMLKAEEIECRIATIKDTGVQLLLYKTARTDMDLLDETVQPMNWKSDYKEIKGNMYCGISIYDEDKREWIEKWDCGTESFSDKEKGEASDSFKRAGFKWGIGRELYTSPFIWINKENVALKEYNGKLSTYDKFKVTAIKYNEQKEIIGLQIKNQLNKEVFIIKPQKNEKEV